MLVSKGHRTSVTPQTQPRAWLASHLLTEPCPASTFCAGVHVSIKALALKRLPETVTGGVSLELKEAKGGGPNTSQETRTCFGKEQREGPRLPRAGRERKPFNLQTLSDRKGGTGQGETGEDTGWEILRKKERFGL